MSFSGAPGGSGGCPVGGDDNYLPPPPPPPPLYSCQMKLWDVRHLSNYVASILGDYKGWISRNPGKASDVESFFKVLAYLLPGRIRGNSTVLPELLYSTANVVTFWHDQILQKELEYAAEMAQRQQEGGGLGGRGRQNGTIPGEGPRPGTSSAAGINSEEHHHVNCPALSRRRQIFRIQVCLTILEYFEVFLEVAARKMWGDAGRWIMIFVMQSVKAVLRSVLVFYYKVGVTRSPALATFDRTKYQPNRVSSEHNAVFVLKHSGRAIRKLHASPPLHSRNWTLPELPFSLDTERHLSTPSLIAEVIHITRPLCHLISLGACGTQSWKPWLLSLAMDLSSIYLHGDPAQHHKRDSAELQRRSLSLLLYLLRSPFYDYATKQRLLHSLEAVGGRLPLIGNLFRLLAQAIPQWQGTYSYVWS